MTASLLPIAPIDAGDDVVIEPLHPDVTLPVRATPGSAGCDLRAYLRDRDVRTSDGQAHQDRRASLENDEWGITIAPGVMALIPLGFRTRLPQGMEAQIRARSGQVFKRGLTVPNAPGTVDADYAEEWMVILRNDGAAPTRVVHGERIAQVVFASVAMPTLRQGTVGRTTERAGGFGSTGRG